MAVTQERYSLVARWLHWGMALLIIANLIGGLFHEQLGAATVMPLHKATGILILFLAVIRILWRMTVPAPHLPAEMQLWERATASFLQSLMYALMILIPLSGWIMSSAGPKPISFYGLFDVPKFHVVRDTPIWSTAHEAHELLAYALLVLAALHIAAAIRHHFVLKDGLLHRMWA
jgi:cytochrome b561